MSICYFLCLQMASNSTDVFGYLGDTLMDVHDNSTGQPGDPYERFYQDAQFITGIICYPIICIFGITGNILTLIVLGNHKMLTSTNVFLKSLAVADVIKLLNDTLYFIDLVLLREAPLHGNRMLGYMYPFSHYIFNQSVCVASWLTVSVAVERYISVCHATKAKEMCTVQRARVVSILVFVIMSLVAVPSAFRYTSHLDPTTNYTLYNIHPTTLGQSEPFITIYTWVQNLLRSVIPLCVLIVLNARIIHALRIERVKGKKMSARNRITFMLIIVIIVFLMCITPDAIMSTCFGFGYIEESSLVKGIREFTDTLLALNSAVNFIIYCMCSRGFRCVFWELLCRMFCGKRATHYHKVTQRMRGHRSEIGMSEYDVTYRDNSNCLAPPGVSRDKLSTVSNGNNTMCAYTGPQTHL